MGQCVDWFFIFAGAQDFGGLLRLRTLSLSGNNIIDIDPGALDRIGTLTSFYFGKNHFGDVPSIFGPNESPAGHEIRHLGLQTLAAPCVDPALFAQLPKVRWIYLNQSQPIYVDFGSFRNISEKLILDPPQPEAFRTTSWEERGCQGEYLFASDNTDEYVSVMLGIASDYIYLI